ncbi:MAG TPA: SDR family NAD(P)-dependent oxidoreductase [Gammaproteobacteria bacterium]
MPGSTTPPPVRPEVVFVTGATSGFGLAIARRFAALGSRLIIAGRRRERLDALAAELDVPVHVITLDVRDRDAVFAAVEGLPEPFREIDVLVNNAGLALGLEPAHECNLDDWYTMIDTNDRGLVTVTRAVSPGMIARNRGHIFNISSVAGSYPYPSGSVYCASKAFVTSFSLALRGDFAGTNVRVTNIEPGLAETEFSLVRFKGDAAKAGAAYVGTTPLSAEDIAESVLWAATLPAHVNINRIEVMPTCQGPGPFVVRRREQ